MRAVDEGYVTTADGVRLFFQTFGRGGPTVVIPNGFHLLEDFARLTEDCRLLVYDVRNRGRSDTVTDPARLDRGVLNDAEDVDEVRQALGVDGMTLLGHSYVGLTVVLYAMKHPDRVARLVQIGPSPPSAAAVYPPELTGADETLAAVLGQLAEFRNRQSDEDPVARCRTFWSLLRVIYVTDPANADRIRWDRCDLPNERNLWTYYNGQIIPSIARVDLANEDVARVRMPVLTIHGTRDRSAPYGGGRDWALKLPDARLVTVDGAGHAPWIENPDVVFGSIRTFLGGSWPDAARRLHA